MPEYFSNTADYLDVSYRYLLLEKKEGILKLTLNRPEKRNAFSPLMIHELAYAIQGANADMEIKAVQLEAAPPVFCAGMDLKIFRGEVHEDIPEKFKAEGLTMALALRQLEKPLIAVVEGPVIAGGFLILNECHMVLAREDVWFRLPEIEIGLFPFQVMEKLPEIVGERTALDWALTGKKITSGEALSTGLVNRAFTKETRDEVVQETVSGIQKAEVKLLKAAISMMRKLKTIPDGDRASELKKVLDQFSGRK
ncbi:enoyl-CoA hydratase/isomerase family protein [Jiulongibacter sediminis]|uniref:enoyl-CoA hydratase/isomerase family protein n=1 Tax=Jiulongibacter sediminis TaxID=1605367 RepID=UPI0006DC824E|nr:enoyl-CoA hydratase/isomerase family protein [Jiulongibacter sediminis]